MSRILPSLLLFLMTAASAAVFQWYDDEGGIHYSDRTRLGATKVRLVPEFVYTEVEYVYDGDTVKLRDGRKVRLLNINAPEIEHERKRGEPGGQAAKERLRSLLSGRKVRLEFDVERRDKYGRTLAYLFTERHLHLNEVLVREGLAIANIHPPNLKYAELLLTAQADAEREKRGIWGMPEYAPKPMEILQRKRLYGWQRLVGIPHALKQGRKYVRLRFSKDLYVTIPRANLKWFPDLEGYLGRRVEVRGWPSRRGRVYSVLVRHPSALVVLD